MVRRGLTRGRRDGVAEELRSNHSGETAKPVTQASICSADQWRMVSGRLEGTPRWFGA